MAKAGDVKRLVVEGINLPVVNATVYRDDGSVRIKYNFGVVEARAVVARGRVSVSCGCIAFRVSGVCPHVARIVYDNVEEFAEAMGVRSGREAYNPSARLELAAKVLSMLAGQTTTEHGTERSNEGPAAEKKVEPLEELKKFIDEFASLTGSRDYALTLSYALVSSADFTEPPAVVHVVGEPGTFKTSGAIAAAKAVEMPVLVARYTGSPEDALEAITSTFSRHGLMEPGVLGGAVKLISATGSRARFEISVPHLESHGVNPSEVASELARAGFEVAPARRSYRFKVLDPSEAAAIEDYRYRYVPLGKSGFIRVTDALDNEVVVLDEGCRNPQAIEALLTRMSVSLTTESARVYVITDNVEPFLEAMGDGRLAALADRAVLSLTSALAEPRKPVLRVRVSWESLRELHDAMEKVAVPHWARVLVKTAEWLLSYEYGIDGDEMIISRVGSSRAPAVVKWSDIDYVFHGGGRFERHALGYARFLAVLEGRSVVTKENVIAGIVKAAAGRLVFVARDGVEYREVLAELLKELRRDLQSIGYYDVSDVKIPVEDRSEVPRVAYALAKSEVERSGSLYEVYVKRAKGDLEELLG